MFSLLENKTEQNKTQEMYDSKGKIKEKKKQNLDVQYRISKIHPHSKERLKKKKKSE